MGTERDFVVKKGLKVAEGITLGGHTFNDIDIGSEHVDADDHIMSSGAIKEYVDANAGGASAIDDLSDAITTANSNVGLGSGALDSLTASSGNFNVALGVSAATNITTGDNNLAIGMNSLFTSTTGASNVALGHFANYAVTDGKWNIAVGHNAGRGTTSGDGNISIGYQTGAQNASTGGYNTGVGYGALTAVTSGGSNLAFGFQSGDNITTGSNNVVIGKADVTADADDQLSISSGDGGVTWITGNSSGGINSKAEVVAVSSNTTLTLAQTGSYVFWTNGSLTLPASGTVGTQYTIFNNTGGSATVQLNASNCSIVSGWPSVTATGDHEAVTFVCVTANNWVQIG